jgi:hypothetical protein
MVSHKQPPVAEHDRPDSTRRQVHPEPGWRRSLEGGIGILRVHKSERSALTFYWSGDGSDCFMLMPDERALFLTYCNDHPVAVCHQCCEPLTFERIGADLIRGKSDFCPMCRADLTDALREHLAECTFLRVQARETRARTQEVGQDAAEPSNGARGPDIGPMCSRRSREGPAIQPQREIERDQVSPLNEPTWPDETPNAVQESERLRDQGRKAIDEAQRIGRDYIAIEAGRPEPTPLTRVEETRPPTDGTIRSGVTSRSAS